MTSQNIIDRHKKRQKKQRNRNMRVMLKVGGALTDALNTVEKTQR